MPPLTCPKCNSEKINIRTVEASKKNYLPWIIGGGIVLAGVIGLIIYFFTRKKDD